MENKPRTIVPAIAGRNGISDWEVEGGIILKVRIFWIVSFVSGQKSFNVLSNFIPHIDSSYNHRSIRSKLQFPLQSFPMVTAH